MWRAGPLSLAYLTVDGATCVEHIEAAAAGGFDMAGVRIAQPGHLRDRPAVVGNEALAEEIREACRCTGVSLLDAEVACLGADTTNAELEAMVATANALGFQFVQTVVDNPDLDWAARQLKELAELAAAADLKVALEFMAFRPLSDLGMARDFLDRVDAPNIALLIDALHLARSGGDPEMVSALPPKHKAQVQLCDGPLRSPSPQARATEPRTARLHPGDGALRLNELLDAVPDGLPLSLEVPHGSFTGTHFEAQAREAMSRLREFLQKRRASRQAND